MRQIIIIICIAFIGVSCMKHIKIKQITLINLVNDKEFIVQKKNIQKISDLLENGLTPSFGCKCQKWKYFAIEYADEDRKNIILYEEGYLKKSGERMYYKVKKNYLDLYKEVTED